MSKEIKYALRHKKSGKLLGFYIERLDYNDAYYLDYAEDIKWFAMSPEHAEWVRQNNTAWYNSKYETPCNSYCEDELEVVKLTIETVEEVLYVKLSEPYDCFDWGDQDDCV